MVKGVTMGDDIGKIFVGGLSHDTTPDSLKLYFSNFGVVNDCTVMKDPATKKSRGFGFVTFNDPGSVDAVVAQIEPHILDGKTIDPKRAVPRGPGQGTQLAQQSNLRDNNVTKVFVGGIANGTTEDDLLNYFKAYGKVVHVHLMYDNQPGMPRRMRGFGFVTFESSQAVEKTTNIHFHQINGKTVEVKRAEQRDSKSRMNTLMGSPPSMPNPYQQPPPAGPPAYAQYPQQATYGMQHPVGVGRGYPAYGAVAPAPGQGYAGAPGAVPGYGYGVGAPAVPAAPYGAADPTAAPMYGRGSTPGREGPPGYPAPGYAAPAYSTGVSPAQPAPVSVASASYPPDFGRAPAPQAAQPIPAPAAPHVENPGVPDYSSYGLGNYQQQDLQYGPTRTSFSSDASYGTYNSADPNQYGSTAAVGYGESFGRGTSASRGFHPYGR